VAYNKFIKDTPTASDLGADGGFAEIVEKNQQALRDAVVFGALVDWDLICSPATDKPTALIWYEDGDTAKETVIPVLTWTVDNVTQVMWYYRDVYLPYDITDHPNEMYSTETLAYDVDDNLTSITWSQSFTLLGPLQLFQDSKPVKTDPFMEVVTSIRDNSRALRNNVMAQIGEWWNYSVSGGSAEEPAVMTWEKVATDERIRATVTYTGVTGYVSVVDWAYQLAAAGYVVIGKQTFTYDGDGETVSIVWSLNAHDQFKASKPSSADAADTLLLDIKQNFIAIRDGDVIGAMYWDYSKTDGTGSNDQPQYYFHKQGTLWMRITNTWGVGVTDLDSITQQLVEYSENSGVGYDTIGTVTYTYASPAVCTAANWT
jgi:hypothetical protein